MTKQSFFILLFVVPTLSFSQGVTNKKKGNVVSDTTKSNLNTASNTMTLLESGRAGIGEPNPLARLHLNTSFNEDYFRVDQDGVRKLTLKSNSRGDLLYDLQSNNTFIGKESGAEFTNGSSNSFFGNLAGYFVTSGSNNVFLGAESGRVSTGDDNTFVGNASGASSSGSRNVFLGRSVGQLVSDSNRLYIHNERTFTPLIYGEFDNRILKINGELKASGGLVDEDGDTKIWVEKTLDDDLIRFELEGEEKLIFIKNNADYARLDFIGNNGNTLIGQDAGLNLPDTSSNNTFIGDSAGEINSSGISNTFLGFYAGQANTGSYNTFLGTAAGAYSGSGSRNVFIGHSAGGNSSASQRLFIDNSSELEPLIYGEFDNNKVEINGDLSIDNFLGSVSQPAELKFKTVGSTDYSIRANPTSKYFVLREDHTARDIFFLEDGRIGIRRRPTTNALEVNGTASKSSAGDWIANSDARLKKKITNLSSQEMLNKIVALQGITYEWNDHRPGFERPKGNQFGFTAQNINEQFPSLVSTDAEGYLQTSYGTFDAMYVESIKALLAKIESLESVLSSQEFLIQELQKALKDTNNSLDQINQKLAAMEISNNP